MLSILVVEDEKKLNDIICEYLKEANFNVFSAYDGEEALDLFEEEDINLVVLDIMIPKIDGWSVCKRIRKKSGIPIVILTSRSLEEDKLMGFEFGADEYVTKPFSPKVLVARVSRLINRITETSVIEGEIIIEGINLNLDSHIVLVDNKEVEFTVKEYSLLKYLLQNRGIVLTREVILNKVWGYDFYGELRVVDSHIKKIRKKVGVYSTVIKTVVKVGYKIDKE